MFSRAFVHASNAGGLRRSLRFGRAQERKIALQKRWYVGALAAVVAGSLVFTGVSPAVAEEVTPSDTATTQQADATEETSTDASTPPPAEEPAVEQPPAEEPAAPVEEPEAEEGAAPDEAARIAPLAAPLAEPEIGALAVVCGGLNGGFEIDGNYAPGDCGGNKDWNNVSYQSTANVGTYQVVKDNSNPSGWSTGGGTPPKIDFERVYSYAETVGDDYFLNVAWERDQTSGTGGYVIEVTNAGTNFGNGVPQPDRSNGGAVFYITTHGSNPPVLLQACVYTSLADYPGTCSSGTGGFIGAVNNEPLVSPFGAAIEEGGFFEVGLNVTDLTNGGVRPGCPAAADATLYMRSFTGQNFGPTGNLKGWVGPMTVDPPSTCGSLTIVKRNEAGQALAGATFTVAPDPTTGTGSVDVTTDGDGNFQFSHTVKPGDYTITEIDAPPGYLLPTANNPQQVNIGLNESETVTFVDPLGSVAWVKHDRSGQLLGGATFQITATGGDAAAAPWAGGFPMMVVDNGLNDADPDWGEFLVVNLPTGTYSATETVAPANYVLDPTPQAFTISQDVPNATIATPFVNTPYATVTLTKAWVNSFAGDQADISIGGDAAAAGTSTAPTDGPVIQVLVAPGSNLTLAEALPDANTGEYSSTLMCVGATVSNNTGTGGAITVPQWPASADGVQCTFTNTALEKTVTLQKRWIDAIAGDTAELHAGPATATSTADGTADQLDVLNTATTSVRVGDTVALSELVGGQGTYGSSYSCTSGQTTGDGTGTSFTLTMPNANVLCTFENTADRATVTLTKQWVNAFAGDEADLSITGAATDAATSVATEGNSTDTENMASVEVRVGEEVTLGESLPDGNTGEYTATWWCSDGSSGQGGSIPEFTVVGDIDCTIVNTADEITVRLDKRWVDAFQGDTAALSINGTTNDASASGAPNELDEDVVVVTVRVGDDVNIHEMLGSGANTGEYESVYACSVVENGTGDGRDFDFVAPDSDVTCTFTNTAIKVGVVLFKWWVDGIHGDKTELQLTPEFGPLLTKLSTIIGPTTFQDDINIIEVEARIGAVLPIAEALTASGLYDSTYGCLGGGQVSGNGVGTAFALTVTAADSIDGKIRCFFRNEAQTSTVHLVKTWVNGEEGDSADLSIEGVATAEGTSVSNGDVGTWTDVENAIEQEALIGAEVTVSELIEVVAGEASDYTSTLVCVGSDQTPILTVDARSGTFVMPNQAVWCEFTNAAERPSLALVKVVEVQGADVSDTNWQLFGTPDEGAVVTDPAGGDVAPTPVVAGDVFALSEEVIGDLAGLDEFEGAGWSCVSDIAGVIDLTDETATTASLRAVGKGEDVVCTIVNRHVDQGYEFEKDVVDSVQNEDGSWTVIYEITVHNNSVVVPIEYDLTDTLDAPAEGVTYTGASWTGPTSGSFDLDDSLTAQLADDQELAAFDGSNDAVYTVTVDVEVAAMPGDPVVCGGEEGGIGIVNTAVLTVGDREPDSDDACGTVHFDDVDIAKTATGLDDDAVEPGEEFEYVLTVTNNGSRDAIDVVVTDPIPERVEVTGITLPMGWVNDNAPDLVDGDNVLQVSTPVLGVGESVEITVTVEFTAPAQPPVEPEGEATPPPAPLDELVNTACVAAERDQVEENNCDTVTIPVREITAIVYTECVADAPFLGWTIAKSPSLIDEEIHFLWTPDSGDASTDPAEVAITHPGGTTTWSDEIEWPGAEFTPSGVSIDYPGWRPIVASDIVPGSSPLQYYYPGTTDIIPPGDVADYIFNGLILDDSELDYAWRLNSTVTFTVNPMSVFAVVYPPATPDCFVARHSDVQIEKTASIEKTAAGDSFTYTLEVANVSDDAAAESVVVTDDIPADIKITDVSWPGKGDDSVFPNWETCAVTGQGAGGYGGTLECVLFGPLQPAGANEMPSAAPTITLAATVNPASKASSITNIAVVDYHTFGDPDDPGRDADDATVLLSALPATGGGPAPVLVILGLLALLSGATMLVVVRRRRGEAKPAL
ncbi:SpaA isopeptide-forming pilin-related protein [Microbacterium cremeum]|uniref:SpaA isopeptide-forming pilin-related protein n=1 Tax=Microbacterium cremeum TaxID=2782169 RepID=UPI00188865B2|nr:SpaA isopeptide-forming pilin-related protein [Microbacterium cremeum]